MQPKKPADIVVIGVSPQRAPEVGERVPASTPADAEITERIHLDDVHEAFDLELGDETISDEDELFRQPPAGETSPHLRALGPLLGGPESC